MNAKVKKIGEKLTGLLKKEKIPPVFFAVNPDSYIFFSDLIRAVNLDIHCEVLNHEVLHASKFDIKGATAVLVLGFEPKASAVKTMSEKLKSHGASRVVAVAVSGPKLSKKLLLFSCFANRKQAGSYALIN